MIEIRFEPDQKVRPLLRPGITFWGLCRSERFIGIFREGERVQGEGRACHDEFGECLFVRSQRLWIKVFFFIDGDPRHTYVQQFRTGEHALLHARVKKIDVIAQQLVNRGHF